MKTKINYYYYNVQYHISNLLPSSTYALSSLAGLLVNHYISKVSWSVTNAANNRGTVLAKQNVIYDPCFLQAYHSATLAPFNYKNVTSKDDKWPISFPSFYVVISVSR